MTCKGQQRGEPRRYGLPLTTASAAAAAAAAAAHYHDFLDRRLSADAGARECLQQAIAGLVGGEAQLQPAAMEALE